MTMKSHFIFMFICLHAAVCEHTYYCDVIQWYYINNYSTTAETKGDCDIFKSTNPSFISSSRMLCCYLVSKFFGAINHIDATNFLRKFTCVRVYCTLGIFGICMTKQVDATNMTFKERHSFIPFVIEEFGGMHKQAMLIFNRLCTFIANRQDKDVTEVKFHYSKLLSSTVKRHNSRAILVRKS